ncbi:MAG: glucose-6-phosphate isomerase [Paracoccaceae bacterium]
MEDIWSNLAAHRRQNIDVRIHDLLKDTTRFSDFSATHGDMLLDYSKTSIDGPAKRMLLKLASKVESRRDAMFRGDKINTTEDRAVLHTALRNHSNDPLVVEGSDVMPDIRATLKRMNSFANGIRSGAIMAADGQPFTDVINIGIGGSDLGPVMVTQALQPYHDGPRVHFISNIDGAHILSIINKLNPMRTLVIIASKTFTTIETMTNAHTAVKWLNTKLGAETPQHLVAISSATDKTKAFGILPDRVFGFEDWVGGRYSIWGPIGLPVMLAIGSDSFARFLDGAYEMDQHFQSAPLDQNLPVMLALTGIWHNNICDYPTRAILPYDQHLLRLPAYLQQLDMESNGKAVSLDGPEIPRRSGPVVWGEPGTNGQHAFYQLLHQGTEIVPCEFLIAAQGHEDDLKHHHDLLVANCLAQSEALMLGRSLEQAQDMHRVFTGNRPSTTLMYKKLSPHTLGKIIALYEHRVFVEGCIWNINSFDQWGVELGKELASSMLNMVNNASNNSMKDTSTQNLLTAYHKLK